MQRLATRLTDVMVKRTTNTNSKCSSRCTGLRPSLFKLLQLPNAFQNNELHVKLLFFGALIKLILFVSHISDQC